MNPQMIKVLVYLVIISALGVSSEHMRSKRQSNPGDAFVDAVFQIPIQTLTSVGTLVKATRPVGMHVRQRIQQSLASQPQRFSFPNRQRPQANDRISSVQSASSYQSPTASSYQRPTASNYQRPSRQQAQNYPTSAYNRLLRQPTGASSHRFSGGKNKFFRDSD